MSVVIITDSASDLDAAERPRLPGGGYRHPCVFW